MRYAIVSDIHANLRAWDAVIADIRSQGADVIICLGDVVGYGPNPAEVLEAVRAETTHFVLGNHDAAAAGMMDYSIFNEQARQAIEWTMTELSPEAKAFLASVPLAVEAGEILFVHAEIAEPGRFDYIDSEERAQENFAANEHFVTFVGHTHQPKIFEREVDGTVIELPDDTNALDHDKRYIVNVGSVGEPRNPDDLRARYVIYDSEPREVDFRRVEFDIVAYRADLESTNLVLRPYFLRVYEHVVEGREVVDSSGGSLVDMQVAHNSAALVDLGRVSNLVHMGSPTALASAKPSRAPAMMLGAAAVLTLGALGIWALSSDKEEEKKAPLIVANDGKEDPVPKKPRKDLEQEPAKDTRMARAETPVQPKPDQPRTPEPDEPEIEEPEPMPAPIPAPKKKSFETVSWRMDNGVDGSPLVDVDENVKLIPWKEGKIITAIAPNPVPLTQEENTSALQLGIWQEEKAGEIFGLTAKKSFTFEGWFLTEKLRRPVFLLGTRTGKEDKTGWHIDLRPPPRGQQEGQMSFYYDSGSTRVQALAGAVTVADHKPHHFAIVWNHEASRESGEMKLYLDGSEIAAAELPISEIAEEQANPFRIGATGNPRRLALDELKFTRRVLEPHEFLIKTPILGATMVKSDPNSRSSWGNRENWKDGRLPESDDNIIIAEGVTAQTQNTSPGAYSGSLVLKKEAKLILWEDDSLTALPGAPSLIVMHEDSQLILRTGDATFGPIELKEAAEIWGGESTNGHRSVRHFAGEISGEGKLIIEGVNNNQLKFETANTFTGGFLARSSQRQAFMVSGSANQAFGTGDVTIDDYCSLILETQVNDAIADDADLRLVGGGYLRVNGSEDSYKIFLRVDETVGGFFVDGKDQGQGEFSNETHSLIGGPGKIIVK